MKKTINRKRLSWLFLACCFLLFSVTAGATDFETYGAASGTESKIELQTVSFEGEGGSGAGPSWFTAADYFPPGAADMVDGKFEVAGRLILATGNKIYLQRNYGSSVYDVVATVKYAMDPCFVHPSPDGDRIALGLGYFQPLLIVPTSILSIDNPPALVDQNNNFHPDVKAFDPLYIKYYEADWADNQYLVVNGGTWPDGALPPYNPGDFASGVGILNTDAEDTWTEYGRALVTNIPGASSDVDVDADGNLITGIGFGTGTTGQIKIWAASEWNAADPQETPSLDYQANTKIVAANASSAAYMGTDAEGNLVVGGGDWAAGPPTSIGYAALINVSVLDRVLAGGSPVDESNAAEYRELVTDPCMDDSATGILINLWGGGDNPELTGGTGNIAIMWNPDEEGACKDWPGDLWEPGVTPMLTIYHPDGAMDQDLDGIPDGSDNAYLTANPGQDDTDGDGYGNAADCDLDNNGSIDIIDFNLFRSSFSGSGSGSSDFDSSGNVDILDFGIFRGNYGNNAPFY